MVKRYFVNKKEDEKSSSNECVLSGRATKQVLKSSETDLDRLHFTHHCHLGLLSTVDQKIC